MEKNTVAYLCAPQRIPVYTFRYGIMENPYLVVGIEDMQREKEGDRRRISKSPLPVFGSKEQGSLRADVLNLKPLSFLSLV